MFIITDILVDPFDEGAKIATKKLVENIKTLIRVYVISLNSETRLFCVDAYFQVNKLLFSPHFYKEIRENKYSKILYIPEASVTLFSIIRSKLLSLFTGKDVLILALQPRKYTNITRLIVKCIAPENIVTQSKKTASYLDRIGIRNSILPLGIDEIKYSIFDSTKKVTNRSKYSIAPNKKVLLHVGHIQKSRNLEWLLTVKKNCPEVEVIIVGSTYNKNDEDLYRQLVDNDIKIIKKYTPNMEELYNLADYYVFPVLRNDGAIETPLSVLEAMACNLPIITTRFGSLPDTFSADEDFHYVESVDEIIQIIGEERDHSCRNREKILPFTWDEIARKLIEIVEH